MDAAHIAAMVKRLKPGQQICFFKYVLDTTPEERGLRMLAGAFSTRDYWTVPDRVLEKIVGAAYEYGYFEEHPAKAEPRVVFFRLSRPLPGDGDLRSYVSPDRRDYFEQDPFIKLWRRKA